jgi:choline transport protein
MIGLLVTSDKADNKAVWQTFVNAGGWPNDGVSFCLGFLTPAFALFGVDAIVHMSEETKDAALNIPRAMVGSIAINGICGFAYIVTVLYSVADIDAVLSNGAATGFPIIEVFHQATRNPSAATAMMCGPILIFCMAVFGVTASTGRHTWAFARGKGLPFSRFLSVLTEWNKTPTRAILVNYIVTCLLSLVNIGSTVAFNGLLSLATIGIYSSYALPILVFAIRHHSKTNPIRFGPWRMPKILGMIANWAALAFCIFLVLFLPFPPVLPVTAVNMNWASVVFIGVMGFAVGNWFFRGKGRFVGPVTEVERVEVIARWMPRLWRRSLDSGDHFWISGDCLLFFSFAIIA